MHYTWFSSTFLRFLTFSQIKNGGPNFLRGTNSAKLLNYLAPFLYLGFKNLKDPNFLSLITFQSILHDSAVLFSVFKNLITLERGRPNFLRGVNSAERLNYLVSFLYFNFKYLEHLNSSSLIDFNAFYMIQHYFFWDFEFFLIKDGGRYFLTGTSSLERLNY